MTPAGTLAHSFAPTPVGALQLVASDDALVALYFPRHQRQPPVERLGRAVETSQHPILQTTARQLAEYFRAERTVFDVPLAPRGNDFQHQVWAVLRTIGYGQTTTYGAIAERLGQPGAAQAVGTANARNPISIIVPCHRVIGSDGTLTGYAGGLERKQFLLELEGAIDARLF